MNAPDPNAPDPTPTLRPHPLSTADTALYAQALRIADQQCIVELESNGVPEPRAGVLWYDTRPMLDPREHSGECVDINREILAYGEQRSIVVRHPLDPWLLRVARPGPVVPTVPAASTVPTATHRNPQAQEPTPP